MVNTDRGSVAIIPARGGSKRLEKKNVLDIGGQPMIHWTIKAAIESELFERVLVSTDDENIAEVSMSCGAEVPFLRSHAADDHSPVSDATIHSLLQAEDHWATRFDTVVQLMANCPFRSSDDISEALARFHQDRSDFQISCFEYGWMNPWWAVTLSEDGTPTRVFDDAHKKRSQDLPKLYCPSGAIWIARRDALLSAQSFYGPEHKFHPISWLAALDIDSAEDLRMARGLWASRNLRD